MAEPTPEIPRRALLKSADVCEIIKVQPYVLRSWEKEFPDLGSARTAGGPRFYRKADVERVQRLKQLVFGEGLTIAGARRRLEEERGTPEPDELPFEDEPASTAVATDLRQRIDRVRQSLRSLLEMLSVGSPRSAPPPSAGAGVNGDAAPAPEPLPRDRAPKRRRAETAASK